MEKICEKCKYWECKTNDGLGECHFNPPVIVETSKKIYDKSDYYQDVMGVFPKSYSVDWCGKFEIAECLLDEQE